MHSSVEFVELQVEPLTVITNKKIALLKGVIHTLVDRASLNVLIFREQKIHDIKNSSTLEDFIKKKSFNMDA